MSALDKSPVRVHARACTRTRRRVEDSIHRSIVHWLRAVLPAAEVLHVPNAPRSAVAGARLKGLGLRAGAPDLLLMLPGGQGLWIEVKAPKGRLSPAQHAFADRCQALGWPVVVARSIDDVRSALDASQIKTREAA
jgi:hypothetical protein